MASVALFAQSLDNAESARAAADNDDPFLRVTRDAALEVGFSPGAFDGGFFGGNIECSIMLGERKDGESI